MASAPDPAELLRDIANGIDDGLPALVSIDLIVVPHVVLRAPDNDPDTLKRWADWFRLGEPLPGRRVLIRRTDGAPWRAHESLGQWHEWQIRLWAAIDT